MQTTDAILSTIRAHSSQLQACGVSRIGVFGSASRGDMSPTSDVDVLIDFQEGKKTYKNFISSTHTLEQALQLPVDAVTSGSISPYIKPYIEKDIRYVQI